MSKKWSPLFRRSSIDGKLRGRPAARPSRKTKGDPMLKENAPRIRTEVQVMFFDTDCAAVVHNIAYLRFIEIARTLLADARTFSLEETFLSPQILNPPPTRHALLAFLLALAAVLHIGTAGWGDLYDGAEGHFAGGAREMVESGYWLVAANNGVPLLQTPPLTFWSIAASSKIFGVNATAARLPIAFAMIGLVALTFLIGERLAGYWRGFAAGLILLCSGSSFVPGRIVAPDAIFALFLSGALYCVIRGYQHRKFRRAWFAGVWFCAGLASLTKGLQAILYLAALCGLLAIFFREARLRF